MSQILLLLLVLTVSSQTGLAFTSSEQGVKEMDLTSTSQLMTFTKSLYKNAEILVHIVCPGDGVASVSTRNATRFQIGWLLRQSPCAAEYSGLESDARRAPLYYDRPELMQVKEFDYKSVKVKRYPDSLLVGHPMEVLKVQLQLAPTGHATLAVRTMFSKGLQQGLFQGMALPMVSFTTINSVFFGVYGQTIALLQKLRPDSHHGNVFLAGMAGGAAQLPLVAPVELIKTAMQAQLSRRTSELHRGPLACASAIVRREGAAGLTRGFAVTFLRDVPSYGLYMLAYDWLYSRLGHMTGETAATMLSGGLAGSVSWLSVLPIDNVKSNMQAEAACGRFRTPASRRSALTVARQILHEHGIAGFYRGSFVVIVRSFPVNAVTFLVWRRTSNYLGVDRDR